MTDEEKGNIKSLLIGITKQIASLRIDGCYDDEKINDKWFMDTLEKIDSI